MYFRCCHLTLFIIYSFIYLGWFYCHCFFLYTQASQAVLIALFELNTPEFSMMLSVLPKTYQVKNKTSHVSSSSFFLLKCMSSLGSQPPGLWFWCHTKLTALYSKLNNGYKLLTVPVKHVWTKRIRRKEKKNVTDVTDYWHLPAANLTWFLVNNIWEISVINQS